MNYDFIAQVNGNAVEVSSGAVAELVKRYPGKKLLLTASVIEKNASTRQRGHYFAGIVEAAARFFGMSEEDMHDFLKSECNKRQVVLPSGVIKIVVGSTAGMKKKAYHEYLERCTVRLAELGFVVESPEEYFARKQRELDNSQKVAL